MEERIQHNIESKLKNLGINMSELKPFMIKRLEDTEALIDSKNQSYIDGVSMIKSSSYTLKSISEELNCSRTTLYNHDQLLKRYIELSDQISEEKRTPIDADKYALEIEILTNQISKMEIRDVNEAITKVEIKRLQDRISTLEKDKESLYLRLIESTKELNEYKRKEMTNKDKCDTSQSIISIKK